MDREKIRPKFDKLNGKQTAERTLEITLFSSIAGACASALSLSIAPAGLAEAALRAGTTTATFAMMGVIFSATTGFSASYRDKDTPTNYFIGGCASGLFLGARTRSFSVGSGSCAALGSWAAGYKYWKLKDWGPFIPDRKY